jgi:hypothetical protein
VDFDFGSEMSSAGIGAQHHLVVPNPARLSCLWMLSMTAGSSEIHVSHCTWRGCVLRSKLGHFETGRSDKVVHLSVQVTASCNMAPNWREAALPAFDAGLG